MAIKGLNEVGNVIKGSEVLIMGLTYKENVPDTRESPVREMVKELKEFGIDVFGYDPLLSKEEIEDFGVKTLDFSFSTGFLFSKKKKCVKVDCVIVAVAHNEFKKMELEDLMRMMNDKPVLIDVRGLFDGKDKNKEGFYYKRL
jgi:UDPglucose 6-dehydrogenase/UDP-N-acetyl-D-galactosamine dehydrogenase